MKLMYVCAEKKIQLFSRLAAIQLKVIKYNFPQKIKFLYVYMQTFRYASTTTTAVIHPKKAIIIVEAL